MGSLTGVTSPQPPAVIICGFACPASLALASGQGSPAFFEGPLLAPGLGVASLFSPCPHPFCLCKTLIMTPNTLFSLNMAAFQTPNTPLLSWSHLCLTLALCRWHSDKQPTCQCKRCKTPGFNPSGRSPGGGRGQPLQYSHLENPMDRGAWQAVAHSVAKRHD